jgi:methylase of polypeptide subunit release factors
MTHDKKKKQDLGIFYTREEIVEFIYNILLLWKEKEDKEQNRWESHKPKHYPSVIDPACGEGIFLKKAVEKRFTTPQYIWGIDIDEHAKDKWEKINLLKSFGSKAKLDVHFFHQNGLLPLDGKKILPYKKGGLKEFDAIVGNPPYGGVGLEKEDFDDALIEQLANYNILPSELKKELDAKNKHGVFDFIEKGKTKSIDAKVKERLKSFPIEVLFIDRFIQLAKPGGWIAIIIPDGILSNSNLHYVREYISKNAKVEAIVSLPRDAFKHVGTSAKTSILFLKKHPSPSPQSPPIKGGEVASLLGGGYSSKLPSPLVGEGQGEGGFLTEILSQYKEFYMKQTLSEDKKVYFNDFVMVRVDKTMKDMMKEKPFSRWDGGYWEPKYDQIMLQINKTYKVVDLQELLDTSIIAPDHVRASKGESIGNKYFCEYRTLKDLLFTGLNYVEINYCSDNAFQRLGRSQLKVGDILFAGSGVGAIGRIGIVEKVSKKSCVGDLFIIRNPKMNKYYLYVYLLTIFGQSQIEKIYHGIQSAKISTPEIGAIKIAILPSTVQSHIETSYKKMSVFHDKAMETKAKGDEAGYKNNIETAEAMLKDLIARTESVIRGEREDVI